MRELRAAAAVTVDAGPEACLDLLADVGGYPLWCADTVPRADVVERDPAGRPSRARVTLRMGVGPLAGSFDELMAVQIESLGRVSLSRVPHDSDDPEQLEVIWHVRAGPPTQLEVELAAALELPRLAPVGRLAASVAQGLVAAASRALSPPSPMASASSS